MYESSSLLFLFLAINKRWSGFFWLGWPKTATWFVQQNSLSTVRRKNYFGFIYIVVSFMQVEKFLNFQMEFLRFSLWIHVLRSSFFPRSWRGSSWVTSSCFVTFFPMSLLPALLLFLPYPVHLFWLWCQNWDLQIVSPSLHFGGVTHSAYDKVTHSAPMVAVEVAVSGSLDKWISPLLSSWFIKCKFCGITNGPESILQP